MEIRQRHHQEEYQVHDSTGSCERTGLDSQSNETSKCALAGAVNNDPLLRSC